MSGLRASVARSPWVGGWPTRVALYRNLTRHGPRSGLGHYGPVTLEGVTFCGRDFSRTIVPHVVDAPRWTPTGPPARRCRSCWAVMESRFLGRIPSGVRELADPYAEARG
jgi:hypothetical protein